jgi:hypothetical protein
MKILYKGGTIYKKAMLYPSNANCMKAVVML